jgi:putative spermidine/putrescine transport system substrate-binding protein
MVAWDGLADSTWVKPFQQQTGCKVKTTYAGSSNQIVAMLRASADKIDVVSASADIARQLITLKLVSPVNVSLVPAQQRFFTSLQSPQSTTLHGVSYGVAAQWTPNTLLYNTKQVEPAPRSWRVIYTRAYRGRITVPNNPMTIADAALYLMRTRPTLGIRDPYELTSKQLAAAVALLKLQKPLLAGYWNYPADEVDAFKNGRVVVGTAWPWQVATLRAADVPVADRIPREGTTGWIDSWMVSARAKHPGCAYRWLRYASTAQVQAEISESYGASPANASACPFMNRIRQGSCAELHGNAPPAYLASIRFWKTPQAACGYGGRKDCIPYVDWQKAWVRVTG